ncbi:hypothetical protein VTK73DRAFT_7991 [Phialemonium thermophilum]|uniref:Uncharacterized protein n=1 Tax=Phialemonium thermophilum TaxID=223376 RepID=A0ABR3WBB6_9PEZI
MPVIIYSIRMNVDFAIRRTRIAVTAVSTTKRCVGRRQQWLDLRTLCTLLRCPSRAWYNTPDLDRNDQVKYLAFERGYVPIQRCYPREVVPMTPFVGTQSNEPWLFTACSTVDIAEIVLWRNTTFAPKPIVGVEVRHRNGHRACVDQFRFDWAQETVQDDATQPLYINSRRTEA